MAEKKLKIDLYFGEPLYLDLNLSVNEILKKCAANRQISENSMKGFLLVQGGYHFIPQEKHLITDSPDPIYYRYVDYHTDRDCLYYIDNPCFQYVYHQYKHDARLAYFTDETGPILTELCAMEILIIAMVFGDPQLQKPHKSIKHYKELTEYPLIDMESKENKITLTKALKNLKDMRTEYECMEKYITTVDKNIKEASQNNRGIFHVSIDMTKKVGISKGVVNIYREKIEVVEDVESRQTDDDKNCIINPIKQQRRELHSIEFSDPKLYIRAFEKDLKVDILTQHGRFSIMFSRKSNDTSTTSQDYLEWRKCVALLFFYANLEYPRSRKEPCQAELIGEDGHANCLHLKNCPLIVPVPPVHYKLTRQDVRMILKRYGSQDGWYMFNTFDIAPKRDENQTNGEISMSYCMDGKIHQMTVTFCQEIGFGPPIYRVDHFRGKKFCSLFELAYHFSFNDRQLHTFITEAMVKEMSVPENVFFPVNCIEKMKSVDDHVLHDRGIFYSPFDDKKHTVRLKQLPRNFWFRNSNARVRELEAMIKTLCDTNAIHENLVRLFGICQDPQAVNVSQITEDFGTCLHNYIKENNMTDYHDLLNVAHQIASGIQALHARQIVHGFPVLHNCLIDPLSKIVKVGGVGLLRIGIATQRLEGQKLEKEQPSFKCETVCTEPRFHPARWLPKESLFDHHFNEQTDRWCFGIVLWQIFNQSELPLSHITDATLVEKLKQEKECWFKTHLEVKHSNKFLQVMLTNTITYCLTLSCVDSIDKVVRLLDLKEQQTEYKSCYTFANLDQEPFDVELEIELEIEEVDGALLFKTPGYLECDCCFDANYKRIQDVHVKNKLSLYNSIELNTNTIPELNIKEYNQKQDIKNSELTDVIDSIKTIDGSDITLTDVVIGQGNFASVRKGILRNDANPAGTEVAVKIYHPEIKAIDIEKEIDAMTQLKHDYIIPLKGVYRGDGTGWLIMNFYNFGSLDKYIEQNSNIPVERLCLFASQIAEGMQFLSNENYIHRDLSTRNVLVQNQYKVRISDLGLSRSVEKQYYKHKTGVIPYLWYPPEFFDTHTYGKSLDVWSYGITCYEIFNNAEVPYLNCEPPITDIKMLKEFFDSGKRLMIPHRTTPIFKTIMTSCWQEKANRWTFNDICHFIHENEGHG